MRRRHYPRAAIERLPDAGNGRADAGVIGDVALVILRNVQIGAYEYPFSRNCRVGKPIESHGWDQRSGETGGRTLRARSAFNSSSARLAVVTNRNGNRACAIAASPPSVMRAPNKRAKRPCCA